MEVHRKRDVYVCVLTQGREIERGGRDRYTHIYTVLHCMLQLRCQGTSVTSTLAHHTNSGIRAEVGVVGRGLLKRADFVSKLFPFYPLTHWDG